MKTTLVFVLLSLAPFSFSNSAKKKGNGFLPKSFRADFEQVHKSSLSGKKKSSWGIIDYQYPGKIRFEISRPDKVVFVSNPKKTWYYTAPFIKGEPGELTVRDTKKVVISRFFDALKMGIKDNKHYKVKKDKLGSLLVFNKAASDDLGVKEALIEFLPGKKEKTFDNIKKILISYNDKKKVTFKFKNLSKNPKFKNERFLFKTPPNTKVSK